MKMLKPNPCLLVLLFLLPAPLLAAQDQEQEQDIGKALRESPLFEILDTLAEADVQTKNQFTDLIGLAIQRKRNAQQNNVFEQADPAMRELAAQLYGDILAIDFTRVPEEDGLRMKLGWTALLISASVPSDLAAEGLIRALDSIDDLSHLNDKYNDLIGMVYGLDGSGRPANFEPVVSRLSGKNQVEGELRDKLIAHLIGFAPEQTFRLVLEKEKKALDDVAALSWFDRRWHEQRWAEKNNIKLDRVLNEQILEDYKDLLKHNVWWVRLYAVELLARSPHLLEKDALKAMSDDPHRLVRTRVLGVLDEAD